RDRRNSATAFNAHDVRAFAAPSLNSSHLALIRRRVIGADPDLERQRLVTGRTDFDAVHARVEMQPLKDSVELVDDSGEVAVDIDLGVLRFDLQAQRTFVARRGLVAAAVPRVGAVPRVVPRVVIAAEQAAVSRISVAETVTAVVAARHDVSGAGSAA